MALESHAPATSRTSRISAGHPRGDGVFAVVDCPGGVERSDANPTTAECGEFQSLGRFESLMMMMMMMMMMGIWIGGRDWGRKVRECCFF